MRRALGFLQGPYRPRCDHLRPRWYPWKALADGVPRFSRLCSSGSFDRCGQLVGFFGVVDRQIQLALDSRSDGAAQLFHLVPVVLVGGFAQNAFDRRRQFDPLAERALVAIHDASEHFVIALSLLRLLAFAAAFHPFLVVAFVVVDLQLRAQLVDVDDVRSGDRIAPPVRFLTRLALEAVRVAAEPVSNACSVRHVRPVGLEGLRQHALAS